MANLESLTPKLSWLKSEDVRPFLLIRKDSRLKKPGQYFDLNEFSKEPLFMDPLRMGDVYFSNALLNMESRAFQNSDMPMPRWVFFDCAVMPGFISGFAIRTKMLPQSIVQLIGYENLIGDWTPVSMFIVIPTMVQGEWVAHNLSSINSLIPEDDRLYGLGFLSKAFGLAYANIQVCCGMTQWGSPALRLHSHYGEIEVVTAYTPGHTYASTLTYRLQVNTKQWSRFFTKSSSEEFANRFDPAGFSIDPTSERSQIAFQEKLEKKFGPFYLRASEIRSQPLNKPLTVYKKKQEGNIT